MDLVLTKSEAIKYIVKISKFVKLVCKVRKQVKISLKFFLQKFRFKFQGGGGPGQFGNSSHFDFFFFGRLPLTLHYRKLQENTL